MRGGAWNKLVQTLLCWLSKRFERKSSCPITINQVETRNPVRTPVRAAKAVRSRAVVNLTKAGSGQGEAKAARTPIAAVREARAARTPIAAVKAVRSRAGTSLANAKAKLL